MVGIADETIKKIEYVDFIQCSTVKSAFVAATVNVREYGKHIMYQCFEVEATEITREEAIAVIIRGLIEECKIDQSKAIRLALQEQDENIKAFPLEKVNKGYLVIRTILEQPLKYPY